MKTISIKAVSRWSSAVATALAIFQFSPDAQAAKTVYDLNKDWSDTNNPTGAWSYNYNDTPIPVHQTFWWDQAGWGDNWIGDGCIIKGSYFEGATDPWGTVVGPAHDWQPGDVMTHAISLPYGGDSTFLNVKWTSPANGWINISGRAWDGEIFADRDVSWTLSVDGTVVAQRSSVIGLYRDDAAAQFSSNLLDRKSLNRIRVHKGSVVEFRVAAQTYYGHFVGVDAKITLLSSRLRSDDFSERSASGKSSFRR